MKATEDTLTLTPVTLRQAQAFVNDYHRHNIAPQGHKFSIGLEKAGILIGVCIVGRPIARGNDDGKTPKCCGYVCWKGTRTPTASYTAQLSELARLWATPE